MLREHARRRGQHKDWQKNSTQAGIKYSQHFARLQRRDPLDCAFHVEPIMPAVG
jgi:hypothetical protein